MSLMIRGLRALRQSAPTIGPNTPEFGRMTMEWLESISDLDPAARELWPTIKDSLRRRRVLFRGGKTGIAPFAFRNEMVYDSFHSLALFQEILEKRYQQDIHFLPPSITGSTPSALDEAYKRWSLPAQHVLKLIGGGVLAHLLGITHRASRPTTISLTFSPQIPLIWELGYSLPGEGEGKTNLQEYLKGELVQCFPVLEGWPEPLLGIGWLLGHCAEARAWLRLIWFLQTYRGIAWAVAAAPQRLSRDLPSGVVVWEDIISKLTEDEFLTAFTQKLPLADGEKRPVTCSVKLCENCAGAAEKISRALGCELVDLIPHLNDANALGAFIALHLAHTRRGLLDCRADFHQVKHRGKYCGHLTGGRRGVEKNRWRQSIRTSVFASYNGISRGTIPAMFSAVTVSVVEEGYVREWRRGEPGSGSREIAAGGEISRGPKLEYRLTKARGSPQVQPRTVQRLGTEAEVSGNEYLTR
ncbi:hypothetical protein B0H16DRAFT_1476472 [Mycena metata]|uniref:Uncharacterized protein n=1 Tax=Mycena metata TaxID=1033252 RepID=A0AAD7HBA7_9AGAR|nr:hypothetical protein B0H16DRAFT_1476472 [Mycena metata]